MTKSSFELDENDFDWLANLYARNNAFNHPSELHGLLIGHLAGGGRYAEEDWFMAVCEHMGLESHEEAVLQPNTRDYLQKMNVDNDESLSSLSMSMQLLLPGDSFELSQRVEGLGCWVRGFLEGLALYAGEELTTADSDIQELIRDFVNISQIEYQQGEDDDMESEFIEVSEYVRMGVITIYEHFNDLGLNGEPENIGEKVPPKHLLH